MNNSKTVIVVNCNGSDPVAQVRDDTITIMSHTVAISYERWDAFVKKVEAARQAFLTCSL